MGAAVEETTPVVKEFMIYNTSHWTTQNGGCCLEWEVPTGTAMIKFEILSGGGPGGSSGHSHDVPVGGQGGNFTAKQLLKDDSDFAVGDKYTLCAAGTSWCSCCDHCCLACRDGCVSYVTGPGLTDFCALGGRGGSNSWDVMSQCYNCQLSAQCHMGTYNAGWTQGANAPGWCNGDYGFTGTGGDLFQSAVCCQEAFAVAGVPSGPYSTQSGMGGDWCTTCFPCMSAHSNFPGGGGTGIARATSSACWGFWGAGGLVKVIYQ